MNILYFLVYAIDGLEGGYRRNTLLPMVCGVESLRLKDSDTALLCIDKYTIEQRFAQFTKAVADEPSTRRLNAASLLFEYFLQSRVAGVLAYMVTAQLSGEVALLCWLDLYY